MSCARKRASSKTSCVRELVPFRLRRAVVSGSSTCAEDNNPDGRPLDMTTLLLAEHDNKALKDATPKALTAAKTLGQPVHVLVAGKNCRPVAEAAAKLGGVSKVLLADGAGYEHMLAE